VTATSAEVTHELARALDRWDPWVVPELALRALGDAGEDLLLLSENVVPEKLLADGFEFRYETVRQAMTDLVSA
jgi:NAD dependent epimerase/dehydratase family enzyme